MNENMEKEQFNHLEFLIKELRQKPVNRMAELATRVATGVSTVAIIGVFSLFLNMSATIKEQGWILRQVQGELSTMKEFTKKARFTKEDFFNEMRLYNRSLDIFEREIKDINTEIVDIKKKLRLIENETLKQERL